METHQIAIIHAYNPEFIASGVSNFFFFFFDSINVRLGVQNPM